jgi:hypothetical protein
MLYGVAQACSIRDRRSTIRDAAGADMLYGVGALAFRGAPGADVGAPCHPSRERVILLSFLFYFFCATLRPDSGIVRRPGRGGGPAESTGRDRGGGAGPRPGGTARRTAGRRPPQAVCLRRLGDRRLRSSATVASLLGLSGVPPSLLIHVLWHASCY